MKITGHSCLENMLYEAVVHFKDTNIKYKSEQDKFFNNNGNPDDFRKAKHELDTAAQRLIDLETARRVIKEIENKGVEI